MSVVKVEVATAFFEQLKSDLGIKENYKTLCQEFNVVPSTIYRIWRNSSWKHINKGV